MAHDLSETSRKAVFISAFDSQLKWCASLLPEFEKVGFTCQIVVPDVRNALSPDQIRAAGAASIEYVSWEVMVELCLKSDVAVTALAGALTRRLILQLHRAAPAGGPVVVASWVGIVIEKQIAGYLDRCGADIVSVNSRYDYDQFRAVAARLGLPTENLMLNGLPFLPPNPVPMRTGPIRTVLFADQPTIPEDSAERRYIYERLIGYARRHPDRRVILKPRHRKGEDTFHRMLYHPEDVLRGVARPTNFTIDYTPITRAMADTDLLLTVSSTACLESVAAGVRTALVIDQGVSERYGNHVFVESGLFRTFDQIEADDVGAPDPEWIASYFLDRDSASSLLAERASELVGTGERPGAAVRETSYFTTVLGFDDAMARLRVPRNYADLLASGRGPVLRALLATGYALTPPPLRDTVKNVLHRLGIL